MAFTSALADAPLLVWGGALTLLGATVYKSPQNTSISKAVSMVITRFSEGHHSCNVRQIYV